MEFAKPKILTLHKKEYVEIPNARPQFNLEMLQQYILHFGAESWDVRASGIKLQTDRNIINGVPGLTHRFDPITIEVYDSLSGIPFSNSRLCEWVRNTGRSFDYNYLANLKRDIILEQARPIRNLKYYLYGCLLFDLTVNFEEDNRFDIEPILETQLTFDYVITE